MKNFWVLTTIFIIIISFIIVQTRVQAGPAKQTALGNWEIVSSPATSHLWGVNIVSEDDIYAVGGLYFFDQDPIVLHCNGTDWQVDSTFSSDNQGLMDVSFFDTDNGLAAGYQTLSHYNSTNWNHEYESATFLSGVDMFGPNSGIAVGSYYDLSSYNWPKYGSIQMYSGGSWQETGTRSDEGYIDVDMLDAAEGWIVGADTATENVNGIVLHRSSTVPNWTTVHTTSEGLNGVAAVSSNDVWTVGANGTIVHYTGGVWQSVTSPVSTNLRRIAMLSATEGWIVGAGGTILHYENGTWQTVASPVTTDLYDIAVMPSGEAWAVGEDGVILHYQPPAELLINYDRGAPDSFFTLVAYGLPVNDTATIVLNGRTLGTVPTDANGSLTFLLDSSGADEGAYIVTVTVNPSAHCWFTLEVAEPIRPQEGTGAMFVVPAGIAFDEFVYMPALTK